VTAGRTLGLTLDTGALLALDHPAKAIAMQARLAEAVRRGGTVCVPVGAIAQAWRSSRQVRLARLLKSRDIDIAVMTPNVARSVGLLCARSGHDDVIDVHVALCAIERRHAVVTSDRDREDISRVDPALPIIRA
jgi:predicted nucleic acid-binding protein